MLGLSLFSGIGCDVLAAEWAGIKTIAMCEINPWCQAVLRSHWPDTPIFNDIHEVNYEKIRAITDATSVKGVDILFGGPPCQPASVAGRRGGTEDDRWLWPEAIRILRDLQPHWSCLENPPGIRSLVQPDEEADLEEEGFGLDTNVLLRLVEEIERAGYETGIVCVPACGVGAPHLRSRYFILAHSTGAGLQGTDTTLLPEDRYRFPPRLLRALPTWSGGDFQSPWPLTESKQRGERTVERRFCGVDAGTAGRLVRPSITSTERRRRIEALGNANPPELYYPIFKAIAGTGTGRYGSVG